MTPLPGGAWPLVTQLGNALWLLPAAGVLAAWLWLTGLRRMAVAWSACFSLLVLLVLGSKLAFLGWGLGVRALDFTGFSGHSAMATSVFTMFLYLVWPGGPRRWGVRAAVAAGLLIGAAVAASRVVLHTHSVSEVVAGFGVGAAAALLAIAWGDRVPRPAPHRWALAALVGLLLAGTQAEQPVSAHDIVTRLALLASGRTEVFERPSLHAPD